MATVNRSDDTLRNIENTKNSLINEAQKNYNTMSNGVDEKYNSLIQASKDYAQTQSEITQAQTDQTIKEINQNKEQTEQDYIKEQKAGYVDYAKQIDAYGTNAEVQASAGLRNSGYSESSKINAYNTYQNRYATARESYNRAVLNYDNQIAQAQLQNSSLLAEIAYNALQTQLQTALEGFKYKNELLNNLLSQKISISSSYDSLWQSQYNTLLGEAQFNEQMAYQKQRDAIADSQWQQQFNLSKASVSSSRSSGGSSGSSKSSGNSKDTSSTKLDNGTNITSIEDELRSKQPEGLTDNMSGRIKYEKWESNSIKYVQSLYEAGKISKTDLAKIMSDLGLGY